MRVHINTSMKTEKFSAAAKLFRYFKYSNSTGLIGTRSYALYM